MSLPSEPAPQFGDTLKDLLAFLQTPQLPEVHRKKDALLIFIQLLGLSLLLSLASLMLLGALQKSGLVPELPHAMEEVMKELPVIAVVLLAAVLMPAIEEFAFRLWLVYKPIYFGISLWLISFFLYSSLLQLGYAFAGYAVLGLATLVTIWLLSFREASAAVLAKLYFAHYGWILYGATALFALVHLINFKPGLQILLFTPVLVLPQFLLGLVLGYTRVTLGMAWAIALHGVYNALVLSLAYTGMQASSSSTAGFFLF